jgi:DNA-binding MarR family transcriptional regulator
MSDHTPKYKGQRLVNFDLVALVLSVPVGANGLTKEGRMVLLEIAAQQKFSEKGKKQWRIFQADIAMAVGLHPRSIRRIQQGLEEQGFITVDSGKSDRKANIYYVNDALLSRLAQEQAAKVAEARRGSTTDVLHKTTGVLHTTTDVLHTTTDVLLPKGTLKGQLEGQLKGIEDPDQLDQVAGSNYANRKQALRRDDVVDKTPSKLGTVLSPDALFDRLTKAS